MKTRSVVHPADVSATTVLLTTLKRFLTSQLPTISFLLAGYLCLLSGAILAATPITPPSQATLLFSTNTDSLPADGAATGPWARYLPSGGPLFATIGSPTVKQFGGVKWVKNDRFDGDGFQVGQYAAPIPCNGVSIVVAVKPTRNASLDPWNSVTDVFYNRLVLGLGNADGRVKIIRNGTITQLPANTAIPDGKITILSLVVQANGTYKVYAGGSMIYSDATISTLTSLDPTWNGGATGYWSYITLGRNNPDPWSTFNGFLGDTFVYSSALSDVDRQMLEAALTAKFITNATLSYSITASAGANGSISPSGTTQVLQGADKTFTITPNTSSVVGDVRIDGVSVGPVTSYTFTNVQAAHTITATFVAFPDQTITASAGANGTINPSGIVTVSPGGTDKTFTITPNLGYKVADVVVDGASLGEKYSYTFTRVSDSNHTIAVTFAPLGRNIPRTDQLLFSAVTESFSGNEPSATGNWASYVPAGRTFTAIGTPTVKQFSGTKWEKNDRVDGDGFQVGQYAAAIPCNGVSIVVAVKPTRNTSVDSWNSVIDVFYNRLVLALGNADGRLWIMRNGLITQLPVETAIPDGQVTILSLVVQADGTYKIYSNGSQIYSNTNTSAMTSLDPKWQGGATGYWSYINIGRNNPDPWSIFNGHIGDVFVYTSALADTDRQMLEADLMAKFITNTPGSNILSFGLPGNPAVIDQLAQTITLTVPSGTNLTALAPTYTVSSLATGNPPSGTARNFAIPQTYTITAGNGSTKVYTVRVIVVPHLSIMNGLALWLDASQLSGLSDGNQVNTWTDLSGQNNHAIRQGGSSAGYPKYVASALNGRPVVRFNSNNGNTGDYFRFNRISTIRSVFWVLKENAALTDLHFLLGDDTVFDFSRAGANGPLWSGYTSPFIRSGTTKLMGTVVNGETTALPAETFQVISLVTSSAVQANQITQDRTFHGSWQGDIAEILIYTRALSTAEEGAVGSYLADKYGLTTAYEPSAPQAKILSFGLPGNPAVIDHAAMTIAWTVPYGTNVASLAPTFMTSYRATCDHVSDTPYDFTTPVPYTVTAADAAIRVYQVTVTVAPMSPAKDILTFGPGGVIIANNITWSVPFGTDLTSLAPTYTVSPWATGDPVAGTVRNFTAPQAYTISAQNGTTQVYTVTVTTLPNPSLALIGHWASGDPTLSDSSGFTPAGTHDGVAEGPNAALLAYSSEVPAGFTGSSLDLTAGGAGNVGVTINNSKASDGGYMNTFDDPILSKFTISFWAKGFPNGGWWSPWVSKHGEGSEGWQVRRAWDTSNPTFTIRGTGNDDPPTAINTNDTSWHHYAGVFDGVAGTRKLYVDGVDYLGLSGLFGTVGNPRNYRLELGARDGGDFFKGLLFDVRIYSIALESSEVQVVMTTPTPQTPRADIQSFGLPGNPAVINQSLRTIALSVPYGTNVAKLAPTFTTSYGATCNKTSGAAYDFTSPLHYIVTSPDATITHDYTVTVTVAAQPPTVTTGAASGITGTSATLNGTVNPHGGATSARFEYGLTPAYGSVESVTLSPANGTTPQNVSVNINGLQSAQIYHYRLTATNGGGTSTGADMTFALVGAPPVPSGFALIPTYSFSMGDPLGEGDADEVPVHTVQVSAFYLAKYEVTQALWDEVRTWGVSHGYTDLVVGGGKAATHPVQAVSWYDVVKWCNARSEKEGLPPCYRVAGAIYRTGTNDAIICNWNVNGYRLPTEAEWEKAARDGLSGRRFPWGDTITHSQANYCSDISQSYDMSPTRGFHPAYNDGVYPYTSPVGSFPASGYGLYDMTGNVCEWCWDWYGSYPSTSQTDPRGASSGSWRVLKGCGWWGSAYYCRTSYRTATYPSEAPFDYGFRIARSAVPAPVATTGAADGITDVSASLHGTVNPNGYFTTAQFEYGLTTSYGGTASVTLAPNNGTTAQNVSAGIAGLQTGTTYHYRLSAANNSGTGMGEDMTFTTNSPPVFSGYAISTPFETAATASLKKLLARASDPESDAISVTTAGPASVQGGTAVLQASTILYTPPAGFSGTDTFSVTLTDAHGAVTNGTITVTVRPAATAGGTTGNPPAIKFLTGGHIELKFQGIPRRTYQVQRSTDLSAWATIATVTADPLGGMTYTDESPPQPSAFYRLAIP
jgi:formylglycine-generating enzyme required for sulfatase activity